MQVEIKRADTADITEIHRILESVHLPPDDVDRWIDNFLLLKVNGDAVGCVAIEQWGDTALLRSLAVIPDRQGQGFGERLFNEAMETVGRLKMHNVTLLTDTAEDFFRKRGFTGISREEAPNEAKSSIQFSLDECRSAAVMLKNIRQEDKQRSTDKTNEEE